MMEILNTSKSKNGILVVKIFTIVIMVYLLITPIMPSHYVIKISFLLMSLFSLITIIYFFLFSSIEDRSILLSIWKSYYSGALILITILVTSFSYMIDKSIDFQKTKIQYSLEIKDYKNAKEHYAEYIKSNNILLDVFSSFTLSELILEGNNESKNSDNKPDNEIFWYINFILFLINLMTMVMFLKSITELSKFKYIATKTK